MSETGKRWKSEISKTSVDDMITVLGVLWTRFHCSPSPPSTSRFSSFVRLELSKIYVEKILFRSRYHRIEMVDWLSC